MSVVHHAIAQAEDHPLVLLDQQARRLRITSPERSTSAGSSIGISLPRESTLPAVGDSSVAIVLPLAGRSGFTLFQTELG